MKTKNSSGWRPDLTRSRLGVRDRKRKMVSGMNEMYLENYKKTGAECLHAQTRCEEI
jgi:hypothetical protein